MMRERGNAYTSWTRSARTATMTNDDETMLPASRSCSECFEEDDGDDGDDEDDGDDGDDGDNGDDEDDGDDEGEEEDEPESSPHLGTPQKSLERYSGTV